MRFTSGSFRRSLRQKKKQRKTLRKRLQRKQRTRRYRFSKQKGGADALGLSRDPQTGFYTSPTDLLEESPTEEVVTYYKPTEA